MKILKSNAFRFGFMLMLMAFVLAVSLFAQVAPASPASSAGKFVVIAVAVAGAVQAVKGVVHLYWPNLIKGRVALILSVLGTILAYVGTLDASTITWQQILLGVFSSSGAFAAIQAAVKGQPA